MGLRDGGMLTRRTNERNQQLVSPGGRASDAVLKLTLLKFGSRREVSWELRGLVRCRDTTTQILGNKLLATVRSNKG